MSSGSKSQSAITYGKRIIPGLLLVYLNMTSQFLVSSERELGRGYFDLMLELFRAKPGYGPRLPAGAEIHQAWRGQRGTTPGTAERSSVQLASYGRAPLAGVG